jgi:hypothetical protein
MIIAIFAAQQPDGKLGIQMFPVEGAPPEVVVQVLQAAAQMLQQQVTGPKLHLPNGQMHIGTPPPPPPGEVGS